jgi:hypothetical protein
MKKTQPPVSPFNSQPALFARVCLPAPWQAGLPVRTRAPKPHCALAVTKHLSAPISTLTHKPFYRQSSTPLCTAPLLYNPHSRGFCVAPRFSPTRFIPLGVNPVLSSTLIATNL